jgi:hypothetical protein
MPAISPTFLGGAMDSCSEFLLPKIQQMSKQNQVSFMQTSPTNASILSSPQHLSHFDLNDRMATNTSNLNLMVQPASKKWNKDVIYALDSIKKDEVFKTLRKR